MTGTDYCRLFRQSPDNAYRALFDEYLNYVYTIVFNKLRSCASPQDIEECVSDVFSDMFMNYDTEGSYSGDLSGYIATIAKRKAINRFHSIMSEKGHFSGQGDDEMSLMHSADDMEDESDKAELRNIILEKVNELGEPDTTIIIQKFYYERSSGEIAEMVSMNPPAVRMRCKRAMSRLRSLLEAAGITL